jgi:Arc/MetJ-type ribon-helix-helix transcriptional regulator
MEQPVEPHEITAVQVEYARTLSDAAYGSERSGVSLWANVRPGQDVDDLLCDLAGDAREFVEARLKASRSEAVRQALETPEERRARLDAEERAWREERDERRRLHATRVEPPVTDETDEERPL